MESGFQDHGQLAQDFECWLYLRGTQLYCSLFYEEERKYSTQIEDMFILGQTIRNHAPDVEGSTQTIVVVKWSYNVEVFGD